MVFFVNEFFDTLSNNFDLILKKKNINAKLLGYEKKKGTVIFLLLFDSIIQKIGVTRKSNEPNFSQTKLFNVSIYMTKSDNVSKYFLKIVKLFCELIQLIENRLEDIKKDQIYSFLPVVDERKGNSGDAGGFASVFTTPICNINCIFCKASKMMKTEKSYEIRSIKETIDILRKDYESIEFDGGEPTLCKELPDLVKYSSHVGFKNIAIQTNAISLNDINYLLALKNAGLTSINVSLCSYDSSTSKKMYAKDVYELQKAALENINQMRTVFDVGVNLIVTKENQAYLKNIVEFSHILNPDTLNILLAFKIRNNDGFNIGNLDEIDFSYLKKKSEDFTLFKLRHFPRCKLPKDLQKYCSSESCVFLIPRSKGVDHSSDFKVEDSPCELCIHKKTCEFPAKEYLIEYPNQVLYPITIKDED